MTTKYISLFPWSVTEFFFIFFFLSADWEILGPNSSVKLDKILINRRQDLIWIAYDLTAGSGIKSWSLASFPHLRPLCDCFQLKGTALPKINSSDGCMSYGTIIHRPLQTLTPFHPPRLRVAPRFVLSLPFIEKNKQQFPARNPSWYDLHLESSIKAALPWQEGG